MHTKNIGGKNKKRSFLQIHNQNCQKKPKVEASLCLLLFSFLCYALKLKVACLLFFSTLFVKRGRITNWGRLAFRSSSSYACRKEENEK